MGSGIYIIPRIYDFLPLSGGTVSGNTLFSNNLSATTYYSGSTPLQQVIYNLINQSSYSFSAGSNLSLITASTSPNITYLLNDNVTLNSVSSNQISGNTINSGDTNIQNLFVGSGITSGGGVSVFINKTNNNLVFKSLSGINISISDNGGLLTFSAGTGGITTNIQDGLNTYTGGTPSSPTVNISAGTLSFLSAGTLSGGTILSGSNNIQNLFVGSGITSGIGTSVFINKTNNNLVFKSLSAGSNVTFLESNGNITINSLSPSNFLAISGGTVTGRTNFNSGLSANSFTATTVYGYSIFSGSQNIQDIFVMSGRTDIFGGAVGIEVFSGKSNSNLVFRSIIGGGATNVAVDSYGRISVSTPSYTQVDNIFEYGVSTFSVQQRSLNNNIINSSNYSFIVGRSADISNSIDATIVNGHDNYILFSKSSSIINGIQNEIIRAEYSNIISSKYASITTKDGLTYSYLSGIKSGNQNKIHNSSYSEIINGKYNVIGYVDGTKKYNLNTIINGKNNLILGTESSIIHGSGNSISTKVSASTIIHSLYSSIYSTPIDVWKNFNLISSSINATINNGRMAGILFSSGSTIGGKSNGKEYINSLVLHSRNVGNYSLMSSFIISSKNSTIDNRSNYAGILLSKNSSISAPVSAGRNSVFSLIANSLGSAIINSNYGSVVGGKTNLISGATYSSIVGGNENRIYSTGSAVIAGFGNRININASSSAIIGGSSITVNTDNTVAVPRLIITRFSGNSDNVLVVDESNGFVNKITASTFVFSGANATSLGNSVFLQKSGTTLLFKSLSAGTGVTITNTNSLITINSSQFSGGIVNSFTSFNSGLSANSFSASTIKSGVTDLNEIFLKKNGYILQKAGVVAGASFAGSPLIYTVLFTTNFTNNNYAAMISSEEPRMWSVSAKTLSGFTINSNSSTLLADNIFWTATENGEGYR